MLDSYCLCIHILQYICIYIYTNVYVILFYDVLCHVVIIQKIKLRCIYAQAAKVQCLIQVATLTDPVSLSAILAEGHRLKLLTPGDILPCNICSSDFHFFHLNTSKHTLVTSHRQVEALELMDLYLS